jgi:hypothetical protein
MEEIDYDDGTWLFVVSGWTNFFDDEPGTPPSYTICGVFDNLEAATKAADDTEEHFGDYIEDVIIEAFPRNLMLTPGSVITGMVDQ